MGVGLSGGQKEADVLLLALVQLKELDVLCLVEDEDHLWMMTLKRRRMKMMVMPMRVLMKKLGRRLKTEMEKIVKPQLSPRQLTRIPDRRYRESSTRSPGTRPKVSTEPLMVSEPRLKPRRRLMKTRKEYN